MARGQQGPPTDWVTRAADDALRHAREGETVTCSSGASPSGPVHLGNLREFLTVHFVADELSRRGVPVRHLHVWDDYDRFRKVRRGRPVVGRPHRATAERRPRSVGLPLVVGRALQGAAAHGAARARGRHGGDVATERYQAGVYREQILASVARRDDIEGVLAQHRTKQVDVDDASSVDDLARFPFKAYCRQCGRDTTTPSSYDDETTDLAYTCSSCGFSGVTNLTTQNEGKLVWKVDWPMRWAFEHVDFEPAGWTTPRQDRRSPSATSWSSRCSDAAPRVVRLRVRRLRRHPEDVVVRGRAPTASDALRVSRRRSCGGTTSAATRARPSTSTSAPRSCGCTTSGTHSAARPAPASATAPCSRTSGRRRPRARARSRRPP